MKIQRILSFTNRSLCITPDLALQYANLGIDEVSVRTKPAILALADGKIFHGSAIGATGHSVGELVFNTAMTGYQEIITDPSYAQQIVTLTYPHIGNVGTNQQDQEAKQPYLSGLVIKNLPATMSNFRADINLQDYLIDNGVVGIAEIDTRALTRHLRDHGSQNACIMAGEIDEAKAITLAKAAPSLNGSDLAIQVTTAKPYTWQQKSWTLADGYQNLAPAQAQYHVVVYDYGVKQNILRLLVDLGCALTIVPATTSADEVLALKPDGIFLSNGPGDPAACDYAIQAIQQLLTTDLPIFGICLGHQLLALALGANTSKMKFGHHGANHPVLDVASKRVMITSQNHGFTVDEIGLPKDITVTHRSLFDNTIQGIQHKTKPAFSFQGHPEASPGPHDVVELFNKFKHYLQGRKAHAKAN